MEGAGLDRVNCIVVHKMPQNCNLIFTVQVVCFMKHMSTSYRVLPSVNCIVLAPSILPCHIVDENL